MSKQVVAVEFEGREAMDVTGGDAGGADQGARGAPREAHAPHAGKFLYASGTRPLAGYTIKRGIGHGGFGEIYYAVSDGGKELALKLVRRNLEVELRGIRHCLNLKHPNLLDLYDIRQDDQGDTWVVMEYVAGKSLEDVLDTHPDGLPLPQVLAWIHGIGAGVAYLHDRGIVHRDLKPGNIFSSEGLVKVGDYGLSKFISCSRRSGHTESVGTVHYMAPEVANGRYGKEIDIYAMGVILYEMLTGRVPFDGESVGEVLMKHLTAEPDVSMLDEPYRSVVARALEKDPQQRFASVPQMLAALPQPARPPDGGIRLPADPPSAPQDAARSGAAAGAAAAAGAQAGVWRPHAAGAFAETTVQAQLAAEPRPSDEEPIARAVRDGCHRLHHAWQEANLSTPVRVLLVVLALLMLLLNANLLLPILIGLLIFYGCYRLVRWVVLTSAPHPVAGGSTGVQSGPSPGTRGPTGQPRAQGRVPPAPAPARAAPPLRRGSPFAPGGRPRRLVPRRVEPAAAVLVVKSARERVTELTGSLLGGALVALAMCLVMVLIASYQGGPPRLERCAWLGLVSVIGTWAVLVPAKFWEGTQGENVLRRFTMMVIGLGVGLAAYGIAGALMVHLPAGPGFPEAPQYRLPPSFYAPDGHPLAMAYMASFGTLMLVLRWWRQADPLRSVRLSLWSLLVTVIVAAVVAGLWHFPQPWLVMVAATISVAVQLASPWQHPRARLQQHYA